MFPSLDPVLHAPARLQLALLLEGAGRSLTFPELQQLTETTAGNLSTHLRKLEEAAYVAVSKDYDGRTPVTRVQLAAGGRDGLASYRQAMNRHLDERFVEELLKEVEG